MKLLKKNTDPRFQHMTSEAKEMQPVSNVCVTLLSKTSSHSLQASFHCLTVSSLDYVFVGVNFFGLRLGFWIQVEGPMSLDRGQGHVQNRNRLST